MQSIKRSKTKNYSRAQRTQNALIKEGDKLDQMPLTFFFDYTSKINAFVEKEPLMRQSFSKSSLVQHIVNHLPDIDLTRFHNNVLKSIEVNSKRNLHGRRYDDELKQFCAHSFLVSGLLSYELLCKALTNLPSPLTLNRLISRETSAQEGVMNVDGLLEYFDQKGLPKIGWLSEDQTKIVERVRYNSKRNTLEGLVSPLDINSCPVIGFNIAETAVDIKRLLLTHSISSMMNVVMIQPIVDASSAFCLMAYGTDNRFTATNCMRRWDFIRKTLNEKGFNILGESGDGDSRYLKAMKTKSRLSKDNFHFDWFHVSIYIDFFQLIYVNSKG